ncbi:hypothetical protein [Arcticibacter sp. MXS-1]|uniref:hypothetical protein n=1 Tax=Arcticibacter sp. MXS-1 TaxID=3341726 RepID=UPI0035A827BA
MELNELKEGNVIKVCPRPGQEGILFVTDIQASSFLCQMISPRRGYQFRIKLEEMHAVSLTEDWLVVAGFSPGEEENEWTDDEEKIKLSVAPDAIRMSFPQEKPLQFVHELQNEYLRLTGTTLVIQSDISYL